MLLSSGLMIPHGMEVLSNSHCSFQKIIQTNHQRFGLFQGCSILIYMLMGVYAWTFSKTSGVQFMMSLLSLPPSSHYSVILIRILLPTRKLHECSAKANESTTEESARLWNKAGLLTSKNNSSICLLLSLNLPLLFFIPQHFFLVSFLCLCMFLFSQTL